MSYPEELCRYSASEALTAFKSGRTTPNELLNSCLERIRSREDSVRAWEYLDKENALLLEAELDEQLGDKPLFGVPVGIKDIIDTASMPTTYGSQIYSQHQPRTDAVCIERLRQAGASILGKTVSTEFAYLNPGLTRNPHNIEHTPGGSSSGSAAAVADFHIPIALGTQTAGSIIRPAAFCGVVGYKPSFDLFSLQGIHSLAPSFDTLGGFARSVEDIILLSNVLGDEVFESRAQMPGKIALIRGPYWQNAEEETHEMFGQLEEIFNKEAVLLEGVELSAEFDGINEAHKKVMLSEVVEVLNKIYNENREEMSQTLLNDYEYGMSLNQQEVLDARKLIEVCKEEIAEIFSIYDLVITPSAAGYAPKGLGNTGDPVFNRLWTALALPCINLPFPVGNDDMPLGLQLVGAINSDARLLANALWCEGLLKAYRSSR